MRLDIFNLHPTFRDIQQEQIDIDIFQTPLSPGHVAYFQYTKDTAYWLQEIYEIHEELHRLFAALPPYYKVRMMFDKAAADFKYSYALAGIDTGDCCYTDIEGGQAGPHTYRGGGTLYRNILDKKFPVLTSWSDLHQISLSAIAKDLGESPSTWQGNPYHFLRSDAAEIKAPSSQVLNTDSAPDRYPLHKSAERISIHDMDTILDFYNNQRDVPMLLRIALTHFFMGYLHPFKDGNGRMARFISLIQLCHYFGDSYCLGLSFTLHIYRKLYYNTFTAAEEEANRGNLTQFVESFLFWVCKTLELLRYDVKMTKDGILETQTYMHTYFGKEDKLTNQILELLYLGSHFDGRGVTMDELVQYTGKSKTPIQSRLDRLPKNLLQRSALRHPIRFKLNRDLLLHLVSNVEKEDRPQIVHS